MAKNANDIIVLYFITGETSSQTVAITDISVKQKEEYLVPMYAADQYGNDHKILRRSTTQTLAPSSTVTITYDSEDIDSDSALNISTGVFTVPSGKAGTYFFVATITSASDMGSGEILSLNLNGSDSSDEFGLRIDTLNSRVVGTISAMKYMDVGDTMHFEVDNGTNGTTSNIAYARFGGFRLIGA